MNWRTKFEHWETQALCYVILSNQIETAHPTLSTISFWYGMFCAAGAIYALSRSRQ